MTYRPKHFKLAELVDPWFLANHSEDECWAMLDDNALRAIDGLRGKVEALIEVNEAQQEQLDKVTAELQALAARVAELENR